MNSGEFLPAAGSIPYGYLRNVKENTYDIDSEAADVVKRIFTMRADGRAFNEIARTLTRLHQPARLQPRVGREHRRRADTPTAGQVAHRRQPGAGRQRATPDALGHPRGQLLAQGAGGGFRREACGGCIGHVGNTVVQSVLLSVLKLCCRRP